jgi:hypothetical protein
MGSIDLIFDDLEIAIKKLNETYKFINSEKIKLAQDVNKYDSITYQNTKKILSRYSNDFASMTMASINIQNSIINQKTK